MAVCMETEPRELSTIWHFLQHGGREGAMALLPGNSRAPKSIRGRLEKQNQIYTADNTLISEGYVLRPSVGA